jgi:subtilisin family serine protease
VRRLRWLAITASLAVLCATLPLGVGSAETVVLSPASIVDDGGKVVTLVTGDVVEARDGAVVSVRPGKGRERLGFLTQRLNGHQYVLPGDAMGLLSAGRVDRSLFDVTRLLEDGYDDARRDDVPLIVRYETPSVRVNTLERLGRHAKVTGEVPEFNVVTARTAKRDAAAWWAELIGGGKGRGLAGGVTSIALDGKLRLSLDQSTTQIGAPAAWQAGFTGRGVRVAVLDSGVDTSHPDFAGRVAAVHDFTGSADDGDVDGHGTHVASIVAGNGAASSGRHKGVAPEATLLVGKVCADDGCSESALLAGMQWAVEQGAKVVNMSIAQPDTPGLDLIEEAVDVLSAKHGTLFVAAAGNYGDWGPGWVGSPSTADAALSVAAGTRYDNIAWFSGRGPRPGDAAVKPEIVAPGVDITAARSSTSSLPGDEYTQLGGTSMASPHVAGAAVLLAQKHPQWSGSQLKAALIGTAHQLTDVDLDAQGAGRVDVAAAVRAPVVADTGVLNLGVRQWPHHDDQPVVKTVTYRNDGGEPLSLSLTGTLTGPGGTAPSPMITVEPSQLSVPAGGTASATITVDTSMPAPDGRYTGKVTATAGSATVGTLVSVTREARHHNLTIKVLDRRGEPAEAYNSLITSWADNSSVFEWTPGEHTTRLPVGDYTVGGLVATDPYTDEESVTLLAQPRLRLTADTTIVLDARAGRPIQVTVPEPDAAFVNASMGYQLPVPFPGYPTGLNWTNEGRGFDNMFVAQVGSATTGDTFQSDISADWARPDGAGSYLDSPYAYHLGWTSDGRIPTGLTRQLRPADLATVEKTYQGPAGRNASVGSAVMGGTSFLATTKMALPAVRTEYYYGSPHARWSNFFTQLGGPASTASQNILDSVDVRYQPGRGYRESWNGAVFGPAFGAGVPGQASDVSRLRDDRFMASVGLLVDAVPGHGGGPRQATDSGRTALFRDGQLLAESKLAGRLSTDLPAEAATYRLESELDRHSFSAVSTKVAVAWTFRSAHENASLPVALPLMAVRFAPVLDENDAAVAGQPFQIPIRVEHQPGSAVEKVTGLTVQVSYDDGATWQAAALTGAGERWTASVHHPAGAQHVSLRAVATDSNDGRVEQTITRAYLLK